MTPIHLSSYNNHIDTCQFLLSCGADPNIPNNQGLTSYELASKPLLKILKDESMSGTDYIEMQLLEASRNGELVTVKVRIQNGHYINVIFLLSCTFPSPSYFSLPLSSISPTLFSFILLFRLSLFCLSPPLLSPLPLSFIYFSPLFYLCFSRLSLPYSTLSSSLLSPSPLSQSLSLQYQRLCTPQTVNCCDIKGRLSTPLHFAAGYNRVGVVEYLLNNGANVHARDKG